MGDDRAGRSGLDPCSAVQRIRVQIAPRWLSVCLLENTQHPARRPGGDRPKSRRGGVGHLRRGVRRLSTELRRLAARSTYDHRRQWLVGGGDGPASGIQRAPFGTSRAGLSASEAPDLEALGAGLAEIAERSHSITECARRLRRSTLKDRSRGRSLSARRSTRELE